MIETKTTKTENPFRRRAAERRRQFGGQYRSPATDRLSDDIERRIDFERSKVSAVEAKRRGVVENPF